jgi:Mrp family chromosome partitioning ATPase/capsular polysaccharide biosynthesis protein
VAYLAAIRSHRLIVVLVTLAAVAASVAFVVLRSPAYEATADLLVEPLPQEDQTFIGLPLLRDTGDPVRTTQTAAVLVESEAAADLAAAELGGDWTGEKILEEAVQVSPEGESNILAITATADSPDEAAELANVYTDSVLEIRGRAFRRSAEALVADLEAQLAATSARDDATRATLATRRDQVRSIVEAGDPTLMLSQEAVPPSSPKGASAAVIVALALIAGLTLGTGTALVLELVTRRIRDEDEAVRLYPLPVLARVPVQSARSLRGRTDANWYMPPQIWESFRTLAVQLEQRERSSAAVMVTSATRGDGKTTSSINLAVTLAASGKRVVLLDLDLRNPQVGTGLGLAAGPRVADLVAPNLDLAQLLVRPSELRRFQVLPVQFDHGEMHLVEAATWNVPKLIEQARELADYVVVDTPPLGEVADALSLAPAVDDILVVMRPGNTSRTQLSVMRELLDRIGRTPEGYIIIGATDGTTGGHRRYGYGRGGAADLVLRRAPKPSGSAQERVPADPARGVRPGPRSGSL